MALCSSNEEQARHDERMAERRERRDLRAEIERLRLQEDILLRDLATRSQENERLRAFLREIAEVAPEFTGVPDIARRALARHMRA